MVSPSHISDIARAFSRYRAEEFLCDTMLCARDKTVKAHSVLLAAVSPVFQSAFRSNGTAGGTYCVDLRHVDSTVLEIALHFIYTGTLLLPPFYADPGELSKLFVALEELGIDQIRFNGSEVTFGSCENGVDAVKAEEEDYDADLPTLSFAATKPSTGKSKATVDGRGRAAEKTEENTATLIEKNGTTLSDYLGVADDDANGIEETMNNEENELNALESNDRKNAVPTSLEDDDDYDETWVAEAGIRGASYANLETTGNDAKVPLFYIQLPAGMMNVDYVDAFDMRTSPTTTAAVKKSIPCDQCGKMFTCNAILEQHRLVHTGRRPHVCPYCRKGFTVRSNLERHEKRHTGVRPHLCDLCGKGFIQKTALQYHAKIHVEDMKAKVCREEGDVYRCSICGLTFSRGANLVKHVYRTHHQSRPEEGLLSDQIPDGLPRGKKALLCDLCGKGFSSVNALKLHKMQHTGEKPFRCHVCDKAFVTNAQLQYHGQLHTGEKPFVCQTCGKGFAGKLGLTQHIRTHTGERPYKCTVCDKGFTQSTHLKGHMRSHTGEKPNVCHLCGKAYKNRLDLRFHYSRVHEINITKPKPQILKIDKNSNNA